MHMVSQRCARCLSVWSATPLAAARDTRCGFCGSRSILNNTTSILDLAAVATGRIAQHGWLFGRTA